MGKLQSVCSRCQQLLTVPLLCDDVYAELKAKLVAINQKIRTELAMQPSQFYHEYYTPDGTPLLSCVSCDERVIERVACV